MFKILSATQIREADTFTIEHEPIASADLMERAAKQCSVWLRYNLPPNSPVLIVCGKGNNGGDGLVVARHLFRDGYQVSVVVAGAKETPATADHMVNLERLKALKYCPVTFAENLNDLPEINGATVVIDALIGSGLSRAVTGYYAELINHLNQHAVTRLAIDIPSGLQSDRVANNNTDTIFKAHHTLTFLPPKRSLLAPEHEQFTGTIHYFDIGLHPDSIKLSSSNTFLVTRHDISEWLQPRSFFGHKGNYGHALIIAGSRGMTGAGLLTSKAALAAGAGLVTTHLPEEAVSQMNAFCPEIMCHPYQKDNQHKLPDLQNFKAVGIGPGISTHEEAALTLKTLINNSHCPLVVDADALNILSLHTTWLAYLPQNSILTPHPKEFSRLAGVSDNSFEMIEKQRSLSVKHQLIIVLKGANTTTSTPDGNLYFNHTGNPGMATAGSGDVLTGIITGLIAQGYPPHIATLCGVWLHGMAGDLALEHQTEETLCARHLIDYLPKAYSLSKH
ncbi:MAG: NAD(P)H-hydrate dehydratase [Bacteroidales bacterium]|nr:NAD(P)H-hydrate dehydratase [Bacteroidales bacterium]MDD3665305.1 NAD(P)H-hydrate dehydratase [Bacteroidales bacterium]